MQLLERMRQSTALNLHLVENFLIEYRSTAYRMNQNLYFAEINEHGLPPEPWYFWGVAFWGGWRKQVGGKIAPAQPSIP
jgi:hypothetical protein